MTRFFFKQNLILPRFLETALPELEILSVQKPSIFKFPPYFESISSQVEGHLFLTLLQKGTNKNGFFSWFAELFNLLCCGEHYLYLFYFLSYILFAATSPFSLKSYVESWARNKHVFIGSIFVTSLSLLNMWSGDFAVACLDFTDVIRTKLCYKNCLENSQLRGHWSCERKNWRKKLSRRNWLLRKAWIQLLNLARYSFSRYFYSL